LKYESYFLFSTTSVLFKNKYGSYLLVAMFATQPMRRQPFADSLLKSYTTIFLQYLQQYTKDKIKFLVSPPSNYMLKYSSFMASKANGSASVTGAIVVVLHS
jgi:hypothetical protein